MERHEHIVRAYEEELFSLNNKVAKMGGLAEQLVGQSLEALENRDRVLAENTIKQDEAMIYWRGRSRRRGRYDRKATTGGLRSAAGNGSIPHCVRPRAHR